uniref:Uncharacterized protein n=1 Tax=Arundo donax TaxID=35708 RepID=A0A0A9FDC9_ARUDO
MVMRAYGSIDLGNKQLLPLYNTHAELVLDL